MAQLNQTNVFNEGNVIGDWLKGEQQDPKDITRAAVTVQAGESLPTGSVLGKITATGKYVAYDPDATDGSQTAAAILIYDLDSQSAADEENVAVIIRGDAQVYASKLSWIDSVEAGDKTAALASLASLGIRAVLEA
jgi:hypothetical protein